ncbi:MAG: beta-N-acetylhexosaminidase [Candidatus Riflebacteria bacterium]|nr:beta-N-acetylhexosaminidase [Candidatus Riflebacteria bacterium]
MNTNLKHDIGQLLVIGYHGLEPSSDFLKFIEEWKVGGVIFFARNIDDPTRIPGIVNRLESAAGGPLFTAVDQEGGLVLRILSGGSLFPGAMAQAAAGDNDLIRRVHKAMAAEMRALRLNWNLAPVLDINHRDNPGIGARSFGDSPEIVAERGRAAIEGLRSGGVLACAKHFPGKGHARVDSHLKLPTIPFAREHLFSHELVPFKAAISADVDAIMTAHVFFPAIEPQSDLPGTLSRAVLTDLLRTELGFSGLLITDDLEMGAITETFGVPDAARRAFLAGADLLLVCHNLELQREAAETIASEIGNSPTARDRLTESLARIKSARNRLVACPSSLSIRELFERHKPLIEEAHARAILFTPGSDGGRRFSFDSETSFQALCPEISTLVPVEENQIGEGLAALVKSRFPRASAFTYAPKDAADRILATLPAGGDPEEPLLIMSYNAHLLAGQREAFEKLTRIRPQTVLAAIRNPYDLTAIPGASVGVACFGFRTPSIMALFDALEGRIPARTGPWPVRI